VHQNHGALEKYWLSVVFALLVLASAVSSYPAVAAALVFTFLVPGLTAYRFFHLKGAEKYAFVPVFSVLVSVQLIYYLSYLVGYSRWSILLGFAVLTALYTAVAYFKGEPIKPRSLLALGKIRKTNMLLFGLIFLISLSVLAVSVWRGNEYGIVLTGSNWQDTPMHYEIIESINNGNFPPQTPSYVGTHVLGYDNAIKAMVNQLGTKTVPNNKVNVIFGIINPGDVMEIKHMLELMDVEAIYLTDISKTLMAPLRLPKPHFPPGGTTVDQIADSANSLGTMVVCKHEGQSAANVLHDKFGVPACIGELPIGVESTEIFLDKVSKVTGKKVPESLMDERDILVDALVDGSQLTFGNKVAIFGDPDIALGLARFAYELGMQPVHVMSTFESQSFATDMKTLATDYGTSEDQNTIIVGGDLYELHQRIKEKPVDLIIGDYKGKYIAKEEGIPLVRVGFPQADRFGYQRRAMLGYRGTLQLLDYIVNTIQDTKE